MGFGLVKTMEPYKTIKVLVDKIGDSGYGLKAGAEAVIVEALGPGPDAYIIEFAIPDETLVGGHRFDTCTVAAEEIE